VGGQDHHSEYLARAVASLTPEGHERVDELLDQLSEVVADREWLVRFAKTREAEADAGLTDITQLEPGDMLSEDERDGLIRGFMTIRDEETLDDVADWANAVLALLEDEQLGDESGAF
jgi:hypothetical protein